MIPEPETREGDLRLAIQSVGLAPDTPWPQVVTALQSNGMGDVLPADVPEATEGEAEAPASTDTEEAPEGSTAESNAEPASESEAAQPSPLATYRQKLHDAVDQILAEA